MACESREDPIARAVRAGVTDGEVDETRDRIHPLQQLCDAARAARPAVGVRPGAHGDSDGVDRAMNVVCVNLGVRHVGVEDQRMPNHAKARGESMGDFQRRVQVWTVTSFSADGRTRSCCG